MMRQFTIYLLLIGMFCMGTSFAQRGIRVGYVDMEYVLENVPEYQNALGQLEQKIQKWKGELDKMQAEIEQKQKALDKERILLTEELIEEKEEEIQILKQQQSEYKQKRFGANGDFILQREALAQPIYDQVFNEIQEIGKERKYDYIVDASDLSMLYAAERHDLSERILAKINRTSRENLKDEGSEDEPYLSVEEAEKREEKQEEREEARQAQLDERQERIRKRDSAREARRREYEKRREEMLKERRRRRDSIEKARNGGRA
jgi:Skp family chaperone for outer membrane proteins